MKKILAVSGGVDSMVMLDIMRKVERLAIVEQWCELEHFGCTQPRLVVATFDHRTRESSSEDVEFVVKALRMMHIYFVAGRRNGEGLISESAARELRYDFLWSKARELSSPNVLIAVRENYDESRIPKTNEGIEIYTAHHLDDLVETVAINLARGTGWRGLAVLDTPGVRRPFLEPELLTYTTMSGEAGVFAEPFDKRRILRYAAEHEVIFRQDPTNTSTQYLRNRLRQKLTNFDSKMQIYRLWQRQKELKREIDQIVSRLLPPEDEPYEREWFRALEKQEMGEKIALELLRAWLLRANIAATRPQIKRFYQAILTYQSGKKFNLPGDKMAIITKKYVWL